MLVEQAAAMLLEQRVLRALEIVATDGVDVVLPFGPYAAVADCTGEMQASRVESVLRVVRKLLQLSLMEEGIKGFPDEDDVEPEVEDAANAVVVSNNTIVKYFIVLCF
jgi:hypothetical protein